MLARRITCSIFLVTLFLSVISSVPAFSRTSINWDLNKVEKPKDPVPIEIKLDIPLTMAVGIDVDDYGRIYVSDRARKTIWRLDSNGQVDMAWPEEGAHDSAWTPGRDGISVLDDGRVMLGPGDLVNNRKILSPDSYEGQILPILEQDQRRIGAVAPDGTTFLLHMTDVNKGEIEYRVSAYTIDGKMTARWNVPSTESIAYGRDGLVYVGLNYEPKILVFDKQGKKLREVDISQAFPWFHSTVAISEGDVPSYYYSIAVDTNGDIYLQSAFDFYHLDAKGNKLYSWHTYPNIGGSMISLGAYPVLRNGLVYTLTNRDETTAFEKDGKMWGASTGKKHYEIQVYTPDGKCVARYLPKNLPLELPCSIAVGTDGSCAVTQMGQSNAIVVSSDGSITGPVPGKNNAMSVLANPNGGYFVASMPDFYLMDNKSKLIADFETPGPLNDQDACIYSPGHLAIDPRNGNIWGLGGAGTLMTYDSTGKLIKRLGNNRALNFRTYCIGMAVDREGFIYVSDAWGHRILKTDAEGNILAEFGKEGSALGELKYPEQIALGKDGKLYVADSGNSRISIFSTDGKALGFWGRHGNGNGELNRPYGVAIGPNNTLWIADTYNDRIVKVPIDQISQGIKTEYVPVKMAVTKQPVPKPGSVSIKGFVIAGTDDFTDCIYIESPDQAWGTRVTLPEGLDAIRGNAYKVTGILELKERAAKHLVASSIEKITLKEKAPAPLGMANLYVGDGYSRGDRLVSLPNLGLLVRTWGRVMSVSPETNRFIINDGSYPEDTGLVVDARSLVNPIEGWPEVGQYVAVTGISVTLVDKDGNHSPGIRIRNDEDIEILKEY